MLLRRCRLMVAALCFALFIPLPLRADEPKPVTPPDGWLKTMAWRCIGPANMGGRIVALAVHESDPSTFWVATASGGLLKTTNNGVTFEHQFDKEATVSIGDVAVAQSNKDIVWVGTGENNPRNSVSYGDGVYKSVDGGKTWKNMGLKKSFQVGRIAIHPTNPDIVYVGALGRLYGPNEERGLFKTTDGGKTWNKVLYVDDKTGVTDVQMQPKEPETLLVATYERQRDGYDFNDPAKKWAPGSAIWKTTDGGKNWKKLSAGLPTCKLGRIGIDWYRKDPKVVFAIVESEKIGMGPAAAAANAAYMGITGEDGDKGAVLKTVTRGGPADDAGLKPNDLIVAIGNKAIRNYDDLVDQIHAAKPGDKAKVSRIRDGKTEVVEVTFAKRAGAGAGGIPGDRPFAAALAGQRENVQDQQGKDGYEYGGVYRSSDTGETWKRINSVNPRPSYFSQIRVDPSDERFLYVLGVAYYRSSDGGRSFRPDGGRRVHSDGHALWIDPRDGRHMILGTDGGHYVTYDRMDNWDHLNTTAIAQFYHVCLDSRKPYYAYGGLQDNGSWGGPTRTRGQTGPINEDWINIGGGDGFTVRVDPSDADWLYYTNQNGGIARRNLRTREQASLRPRAGQGSTYRFNWNTPFILSSHDPKVYYAGGNVVFRSTDRGRDLKVISPNLTATDRGSATALAESPKNKEVLYAGTDDGHLWVTRNGGKEWTNITKNVGLPGLRWVNSIEASREVEGRVYVVFDGHRSDEEKPYVFVSEDFGKTWKSLNANLPEWGTTRVLREDLDNPDLLYLGAEFGCWCSFDRGQKWHRINGNLPTVAIHEIAIHPTANEIVVATHGRSLWVMDASPLRLVASNANKNAVALCKPAPAVRWASEPARGRTNRRYVGDNPPDGTSIWYTLPEKPGSVSLKVTNGDNKVVRELKPTTSAGLNRVVWELSGAPVGRPGGGQPGGAPRAAAISPGTYRVVLTVDGVEHVQPIKVEADPNAPAAAVSAEEETPKQAKPGDDD